MGSIHTQHDGDVLGRGLSGSIWNDCPFEEIHRDPSNGWGIKDDFVSFGGLLTSTAGNYHSAGGGGYKSYQDSGCTITQISYAASQSPGVIKLLQDGTDNDDCNMECGFGTGAMFSITAGQRLFYECRFAVSEVAANNFFFGLAEVGTTVTDGLITDSNALLATSSGKTIVGFNKLVAAPATLTTVYGTAAATATVHNSAAKTLVADTWYKAGFMFDGSYLHYYVNGVEIGSPVLYSATNVPDALVMTPAWVTKNSGAASNFFIDWFACYQSMYVAN